MSVNAGDPVTECTFFYSLLLANSLLVKPLSGHLLTSASIAGTNVYTGSVTHPVFSEIYAPLDGRIINAGIKLKL